MKIKIAISLFCISLLLAGLVVPSSSFVDSQIFSVNNNDVIQNKLTAPQSDAIGIKENVIIITSNLEKNIQLISNDELSDDLVSIKDSVSIVIYHNIVKPTTHNVLAIFDRIFEKQRSIVNHGLLSTFENSVSDQPFDETTFEINSVIEQYSLHSNLVVESFNNELTNMLVFENVNLTFLILLAPLSTIVLFNSENIRLRKEHFRKSVCYGFIFLLLSSAVTIPNSISSAYWPEAFAEELPNDFNDIQTFNNSTSVVSSSATDVVFTNSTDIIDTTNSTLTEPEVTEPEVTIEEIIVEMMEEQAQKESALEATNATSTEPIEVTNATTTEPIEVTNATTTEPIDVTNATTTEPIDLVNATSAEPIDLVNAISTE